MNEMSYGVSVLTISPLESDVVILSNLISHSSWTHCSARNVQEARTKLKSHEVQVVLCEAELPDGDWQNILDAASQCQVPPEVIVLSRHADERLWATVLNLGAWDVLTKPFSSKELYRTVHHAFRHWSDAAARLRRKGPASEAFSIDSVLANTSAAGA